MTAPHASEDHDFADDPDTFPGPCPNHPDYTICWDCATPEERDWMRRRAHRREQERAR